MKVEELKKAEGRRLREVAEALERVKAVEQERAEEAEALRKKELQSRQIFERQLHKL